MEVQEERISTQKSEKDNGASQKRRFTCFAHVLRMKDNRPPKKLTLDPFTSLEAKVKAECKNGTICTRQKHC